MYINSCHNTYERAAFIGHYVRFRDVPHRIHTLFRFENDRIWQQLSDKYVFVFDS